jgi:hypothetical protein
MTRSGWTASGETFNALEEVTRSTPCLAKTMIEMAIVPRQAIAVRKDQWLLHDSSPSGSLAYGENGEVRIAATGATAVDSTIYTGDGYRTDLDLRDDIADVARITWDGSEDSSIELLAFTARLNPKRDGAQPKEVVYWELHVYSRYSAGLDRPQLLELTNPASPPRVEAIGTAETDVVFAMGNNVRPRVKYVRASDGSGNPVTYFEVRALKGGGTAAGNVGWARDSTHADLTTNGNRLNGVTLNRNQIIDEPLIEQPQSPAGVPIAKVETASLAGAVTIDFTTNPFDLGSTPTATVRFVLEGIVPSGSSLTGYVRNNADNAWIAFTHWQDSVALGVSKRQTYKMRLVLTPDAGGVVTPVAIRFGVLEETVADISDVATLQSCSWRCDPKTLKAEIARPVISVIRDGARDYLDAITDLLATNDLVNITIRLLWGSSRLPRSRWMLLDLFRIRNYVPGDAAIVLECVSLLGELKRVLPREIDVGGGVISRTPIPYVAQSLHDVYADLLDNQIGLAGQYRGPGIEDDATTVTKTVGAEASEITDGVWGVDGKAELDAVAGLDGSVVLPDQGVLKAIKLFGPKALVHAFDHNEIAWGGVDPGFAERTPEYYVSADWNPTRKQFETVLKSYHADGLAKLGTPKLGYPDRLPDEAAKWIYKVNIVSITRSGSSPNYLATVTFSVPHGLATGDHVVFVGAVQGDYNGDKIMTVTGAATATFELGAAAPTTPATGTITCHLLACRVGRRTTEAFGTGVMIWPFTTTYAHPERFIGDLVAVPTDRFVAKDPNTGRALRGWVVAVGTLVGVLNPEGMGFELWIAGYAGLIPTSQTVVPSTGTPLAPTIRWVPLATAPGTQQIYLISGSASDTLKYVVQDAGATVPGVTDASWTTYAGPFPVSQLEGLDRQVAAFALRNGVYSPLTVLRIDKNNEPTVSIEVVQIASNVTTPNLKVTIVPDDDVWAVRLYTRNAVAPTVSYPTGSGAADGVLNETKFRAEIRLHADGGGFDSAGGSIAGGLEWTDPVGYGTVDSYAVIAIPLDRFGRPGPRATASLTQVQVSAGPFFSAVSVARQSDGSSCSSKAVNRVSWTLGGGASDGANDVKIYVSNDGITYVLLTTITNPVTVTTYDDTVNAWYTGTGPYIPWRYKVEVHDGGGLLNTGSAYIAWRGQDCP